MKVLLTVLAEVSFQLNAYIAILIFALSTQKQTSNNINTSDIWHSSGKNASPAREITRKEHCYFLTTKLLAVLGKKNPSPKYAKIPGRLRCFVSSSAPEGRAWGGGGGGEEKKTKSEIQSDFIARAVNRQTGGEWSGMGWESKHTAPKLLFYTLQKLWDSKESPGKDQQQSFRFKAWWWPSCEIIFHFSLQGKHFLCNSTWEAGWAALLTNFRLSSLISLLPFPPKQGV